jgi:hypothetical protein
MKKLNITLLCISILNVSTYAQEFAPEETGQTIAVNFVDASNDPATNVVLEAQESPVKEASPARQILSADQECDEVLKDLGISTGWNKQRQMLVIKHIEETSMSNPKYVNSFFLQRDAMYKRAILNAKAKIIEAMGKQMSAKELLRVAIPAESNDMRDLNIAEETLKELKKDAEALKKEMGLVQDKIDTGPSLADRSDDLVAAIIKKIDSSYDPEKHTNEQKERLQELADIHREQAETIAKLQVKAAKLKGSVLSNFTSTTETLAKLSLAGCTTLYSCEEYDRENKLFRVGIIQIWSVKLMEGARASLTSSPVKLSKKVGKDDIHKWAEETLDLTKDYGPRTYVDDNGRYFVGIAARQLTSNGALNNVARDEARDSAAQIAEFSRRADVDSQRTSSSSMQEIAGETASSNTTKAQRAFEKMVGQSFSGREVEGQLTLRSGEFIHPITNKKMFVCVSYVDPDLANKAGLLKAENFQISKQEQVRNQQIRDRDEAARNAPAKSILGDRSGKPSSTGNTNSGSSKVNGAVGNRPSQSALDDF